MRVLIDTNVLIDFLAMREPFADDATRILDACDRNIIDGVMAAHSVTDIFYILRKDMTVEERREVLLSLCEILDVEPLDRDKLVNALRDKSFADFEDCIQIVSAKATEADYIITRDPGDFAGSTVKVISPAEFCEKVLER